MSHLLLSKRFGVEQGVRADGSAKVRSIDDATQSHVNACCRPTEKLSCHSLDTLVELARLRRTSTDAPLSLWKADIKAAFRRIPVKPEQRKWLGVVFAGHDKTYIAQHNAMPFGCVGSVHAWNRVGNLIWWLAVKLLHIPLARYVDDFFSVEVEQDTDSTMRVFQKLVDALMGDGTAAEEKLKHGNPLTILGIEVRIDSSGMTMVPDNTKADKWAKQIRVNLDLGRMSAREAEVTAGRLGFAAQNSFRRLGRAMLQPIYRQANAPLPGNKLSKQLIEGLGWWKTVLERRICQQVPWEEDREIVEVFTDAASNPATLAAVMFHGNKIAYTVEGDTAYLDACFNFR